MLLSQLFSQFLILSFIFTFYLAFAVSPRMLCVRLGDMALNSTLVISIFGAATFTSTVTMSDAVIFLFDTLMKEVGLLCML